MNDMEWALLDLLADGREYSIGDVMAHNVSESQHVGRIRTAMRRLYERGYVDRHGRGMRIYRITLEGRDRLWARRVGVTL